MAKGVKLDLKASRAKRKSERKESRLKKSEARIAMDKKMVVSGNFLQQSRAKRRVNKITDRANKRKTVTERLAKDSEGTKLQKGVTYDLKAARAKRRLKKIGGLASKKISLQKKSLKSLTSSESPKKIKRAMKGSKVMYKDGGALKSVPSEAKGLSKLPTSVRNKMGYMKNGGKVTDPPTKKKTKGGQLNDLSKDKKMKKTVKDVPKTSTKYLENPIFRPSKEKSDGFGYMVMPTNPPKYRNEKTGKVVSESEYYKITGNKKMKKTVKDVPKVKNAPKSMLNDMMFRPSKDKGDGYEMLMSNPAQYRNRKTGKVISESEYYKVTGKKKQDDRGMREFKHGGKVKAMYGAKIKKAMYGAKMKKK